MPLACLYASCAYCSLASQLGNLNNRHFMGAKAWNTFYCTKSLILNAIERLLGAL